MGLSVEKAVFLQSSAFPSSRSGQSQLKLGGRRVLKESYPPGLHSRGIVAMILDPTVYSSASQPEPFCQEEMHEARKPQEAYRYSLVCHEP